MKIKCIIVDDEHLARTLLTDYVRKLPHLELVATCNSALQAMNILQNDTIDLMFLDIQMPDLSGVDFLKSLKNKLVTIFTTAYPQYAIEGYALDVVEYLLKPISFERFIEAVNKATEHIKILNQTTPHKEGGYIMLKSEHRVHKVAHENILYIEGLREYVRFHLKEGKPIISLESLKKLEEKLPDTFMRIHRSYIINKKEAKTLYGNTVEIAGEKILIGKTYKDKVVSELFGTGG